MDMDFNRNLCGVFKFGSESHEEWKVCDIIPYYLSIIYLVFVQKGYCKYSESWVRKQL